MREGIWLNLWLRALLCLCLLGAIYSSPIRLKCPLQTAHRRSAIPNFLRRNFSTSPKGPYEAYLRAETNVLTVASFDDGGEREERLDSPEAGRSGLAFTLRRLRLFLASSHAPGFAPVVPVPLLC